MLRASAQYQQAETRSPEAIAHVVVVAIAKRLVEAAHGAERRGSIEHVAGARVTGFIVQRRIALLQIPSHDAREERGVRVGHVLCLHGSHIVGIHSGDELDQPASLEYDILVHLGNERETCRVNAAVERRRCSRAAGGHTHERCIRECPPRECHRAVSGAVVHEDDFERNGGVRLREDGAQRLHKSRPSVVHGDDDADASHAESDSPARPSTSS